MHSKIDVPKKVKATYNLERIEYYLKKFNNRSGPAHRNTIHTMRVAWVHRRERFLGFCLSRWALYVLFFDPLHRYFLLLFFITITVVHTNCFAQI